MAVGCFQAGRLALDHLAIERTWNLCDGRTENTVLHL
jgi:hypothetical protein